jgi:hypothetical protein
MFLGLNQITENSFKNIQTLELNWKLFTEVSRGQAKEAWVWIDKVP